MVVEKKNDMDVDDDDITVLISIEEKIKEMKLEWAKASGEDAEFIEGKIRDMEEFLRDAKKELGIAEDTEMKDAASNKKRGRCEVVDGDGDGDTTTSKNNEGANSTGRGFLGGFKLS